MPTEFDPVAVVAALNAADVRYVIVGGIALGAHQVIRATEDLDLVPDPSPFNMDALADCLVALGGEHPITETLDGEALAAPVAFTVHTRHGDVQVLNRMSGIPQFEELDAQALFVRVAEDTVAPVCSLAHLRAMKRAAGRPQDLVDLQRLDEKDPDSIGHEGHEPSDI